MKVLNKILDSLMTCFSMVWISLKKASRKPFFFASFLLVFPLLTLIGFGLAIKGQFFFFNKKIKYITLLTTGIVPMMLLFTSAQFTTITISNDRREGYLELLMTTRVNKFSYLFYVAIFTAIMGIISSTVSLFAGIMLGASIIFSPLLFLLILLGSFALTGIGFLVSSYIKEYENAYIAIQIIIFLQFFLSPIFYEEKALPSFLHFISEAMPLTYVLRAFRIIAILGPEYASNALPSILAVLIISFITYAIGILFFKWHLE